MPSVVHGCTRGGQLPINFRPIPSPVVPSGQKIPIAAARAALTGAEAVPKADRARWTSSCAVRPVMAMSSRAISSSPARAHQGVSIQVSTCLTNCMRIDTPHVADTSKRPTSRAIRYALLHKGRALTNQFQAHSIARCAIMTENTHCRSALSTHSRRGQTIFTNGSVHSHLFVKVTRFYRPVTVKPFLKENPLPLSFWPTLFLSLPTFRRMKPFFLSFF